MTPEQLYNEAIQGAYCLLVLVAAAIGISLIVLFFIFIEYLITRDNDDNSDAICETSFEEYDTTAYTDDDEDNVIFNR